MIAHSPAKPTARAPAPAAAALAPVADSLADLFDRAAARWPDAVAVEDPERSLTYRGLAERADALAGELVRRGVVPGDRVGLLLGRSIPVVVSILAALKAGATYVPLDRLPRAAPELHARRLGRRPCGRRARADRQLDLGAAAVVDPRAGLQAGRRPAPQRSDAPAYVIYTSGSTGRPKGCWSPTATWSRCFGTRCRCSTSARRRWTLFHSCTSTSRSGRCGARCAAAAGGRGARRSVAESPARLPRAAASAAGSRCSARCRPSSASLAAAHAAGGAAARPPLRRLRRRERSTSTP